MSARGPKRIATDKIEQLLAAGKEQLSDEEYERLKSLIVDFRLFGLSAYINTELGKIMAGIQWELEIAESPEFGEALTACDEAFLGEVLKDMCRDAGISPRGHKKDLCARLYEAEVPEIVAIIEPYLEKAEIENLAQTEPLYQSSLSDIKGKLEDLYRIAPDEFYRRKKVIEKAIEERQRGKAITLSQFSLDELQEILRSAKRLYR